MSVYSQLGLHTRSKTTHAHKHMHQAHAVQSSPSSQLSHSPLDESFWAQLCSQSILCWQPPCWQLVWRCVSSLVHLWGIMDGCPSLALGK